MVSFREFCTLAAILMVGLCRTDVGQRATPSQQQVKDGVIAYYPSLRKLVVKATGSGGQLGGSGLAMITVRRSTQNGPLASGLLPLDPNGRGETTLNLPSLADGTYEVHISFGRNSAEIVKKFKHKNFCWVGNNLGSSTEVYPPFQPVRVNGSEVQVVCRTYRMNGFGLWDSIRARGHDILASPIALHLWTDGGEEVWGFEKGYWVSTQPTEAVYHSEATTPILRVRTTSTIEYDGCMKVEMELLPGRTRGKIRRLELTVPVLDREAPLFHYVALPDIRRNYAGATPRGGKIVWGSRPEGPFPPKWTAEPGRDDGVLWTCRDIRPWKHVFRTDFVPYIWIGGGERGVAWFGENPRGYLLDDSGIVQGLERSGSTLFLRVELVNKPTILDKPRQVVFGMQASPTRPMPPDWRANVAIPALPAGGDMMCWGGYQYPDKYPAGHDFRVVDEILRVRKNRAIDRGVFEELDRNRPDPWKKAYRTTWLDYVLNDARINQAMPTTWEESASGILTDAVMAPLRYHVDLRYADAGRPAGEHPAFSPVWRTAPKSQLYPRAIAERVVGAALPVYFEGQATDVSSEEWEVYQDEWRSAWLFPKRTDLSGNEPPNSNSDFGGQGISRSYIDFALYYANEWMKRGVSIYIDNIFPYTVYNLLTSAAYAGERGEVEPAAPIWEQREYYKRLWVLAQQWNQRGTPYPIVITNHTTNTLMLPFHTWNTAILDNEWAWYEGWDWQKNDPPNGPVPFPAEFLLTESTGRQVGSYAHILKSVTSYNGDTWFGKLDPQIVRMEWGMRMVHEALRWLFPFENYAAFEPARSLEKALWDFGYGSADCTVVNYWADDRPISISDPQLKWLLLSRKRDGSILLVLQSFRKEPMEVEMSFDPLKLGFTPSDQVYDIETGALLQMTKLHLSVEVTGPFGTRVLIIKGSQIGMPSGT